MGIRVDLTSQKSGRRVKLLTQARLRRLFNYDPETGVFVRRVRRGNKRAGSVAGVGDGKGYIRIMVDGTQYRAHRLAWLYVTGKWPRKQIDHVNCVKDDNRFDNLREASNTENSRNAPTRADNTSGHKGVYWHVMSGKWMARITVDRRRVHLGIFAHLEDAAAAYVEASARLHKDFGRVV